ncbi:MAG: CpaF family protein [Candidatus Micrarchaeota archaeon]|nr:CpaF family protein [Candidatus Micrarchaeota archaeon]
MPAPTYIDKLVQKAKTSVKTELPAPAELAKAREKIEAAEKRERVLIESYGDVRVYKEPGEPLYLYEVPVPRYKGEEKLLISTLVEIASKVVTYEPAAFATQAQRKSAYLQKVLEIIDATPELSIPASSKEFYAKAVVREMVGYGLIDPLLDDDMLEELMVIGPGKCVYVFHRKYEMMRTNIVFYDDKDTRDLQDRIARSIGRRIDFQSPLLDSRLPDGTRVNMTIPPASIDGSTLTVRKFRHDPFTVIDLINTGTINYEIAAFLWLASDGFGAKPANILVSGGTASGKTTMLNVLCSFVPTDERVITIEEIAELALPLPHWIRFETRPPGIEQTGEIDMNTLVKNSLHMRPDRIIVGEIRGEEGFTLFSAINTGHDGSMGTVHANSAKETVIRLMSPPINVPGVMLTPLNFIIMTQRINDRRKGLIRRVTEIAEVSSVEDSKPMLQTIYTWEPSRDKIEPTGIPCAYLQTLGRYLGLGKDAVGEELALRQKILKDMNEKGIRRLEDVCAITQSYILKHREKL